MIEQNDREQESVIRQMPPELAGKIAAGEVIQRPASVVKELLDNAIDAGANRIGIVVQQAGSTLIQVTDNGTGMGREDFRPCFRQHATSKIQSIDDLFRISTLGFRGEAMASIASVSQVEVKSRWHEEDTGYLYRIEGGEEKQFEPTATPAGTSVSVRNLFFNVPARRQFLKTNATEFRHILRVVQNAALSHTEIDFTVRADGDMIYRLPPAELTKRVTDLFGRTYRSSLIPFSEETSYVTIRGLLSDPKLAKKSRGEQFIFVNGRPVQHRYLTHVILSIYEQIIGDRKYPFFAIYLDVDPQQVDVNVHPAKLEVKFEDEKSVVQLTRSVVKRVVNEFLIVPKMNPDGEGGRQDRFDPSFDRLSAFVSDTGEAKESGENVEIPSRINFRKKGFDGLKLGEHLYGSPSTVNEDSVEQEETSIGAQQQAEGQDHGFWQLHDTYILTQTRSGLCVVDQYRAHMRIVYEKALSATEEAIPGTQQLLFAQTVEFSATDFSLLRELFPIIQRMGFSIQLLSGNTAILNGVPADIDTGNEQRVLQEMLQSYRDLDRKLELTPRKKLAAAFASRTAIPRGRTLTIDAMEMMIDQLFACEEPYRDPFGKKTLHYLSLSEIAGRFR